MSLIKCEFVDFILDGQSGANVLVYGRLPTKHWPQLYREGCKMAIEHCSAILGHEVLIDLQIFDCPHFSKVFYVASNEDIATMQLLLKKWQGGVLTSVDHIMINYSFDALQQEHRQAPNAVFLAFFRRMYCAQHNNTMMKDLSVLQVPNHVSNYFAKWSEAIFQHAIRTDNRTQLSLEMSIPSSVDELSVQHFFCYYCHRGCSHPCSEATREKLRGMAGRVCTEATREKLRGRVFSEATREKIRKKTTGRVLLEAHKEKICKTATGRVLSEAHKEKIRKKIRAGCSRKRTRRRFAKK